MYFKRKSQLIRELILITTFTITVCDNRPKYCQCIESEGNSFSAFAKYKIGDEIPDFWLYQNKHMCKMFVKNKKEIEIDTSGQIQELDHIYRQRFSFKFDGIAYQCRTYSYNLSSYLSDCENGTEKWDQIETFINFEEDFNTTVAFVEGFDMNLKQFKVIILNQIRSEGIWLRSGYTEFYEILSEDKSLTLEDSYNLTENELKLITRGIDDRHYINAVLNVYDPKYNKKEFIFVTTHEGIPFYCFKKYLTESTDSCKPQNMKPFISECFSTTNDSDLPLVWIFIAIIIVSILCSIPCFICLIIQVFNTKESKPQSIGDKNNRKNASEKVGKESKIYPKYMSETQVSNNSKIESKETETQLTTHSLSVHSKQDFQKSSVDSIERPVDLIIRKK